MSNQQNPNPQALVQSKRTVADLINSPKMRDEIAKVLPKHVTPERMCRVALTAIMRVPNLMLCSPESLTNSMMILSQAGLEPDGRLAHLIPYWNSKKNCYECQVIFDYKGLVVLSLRNGAESVYADKVCEFDAFDAFVQDGIKKINHRPNWSKPRGTVICYYCVCKRNGEVDWEVMTVDEVDDIKKRSRASKDGPWVTDYDEMGKKSTLRRMSKRWDLLPEIRDVINADDDTPPPFGQVSVAPPIFSSPKVLPSPEPESEPQSASEAPQPDAEEDGDVGPAKAPAQPPAGNGQPNFLKGVRGLCSLAKIKEGELLAHLYATGATDGSSTTLDELALSNAETLKLVYEQWTTVSGLILAARKGGAK